MSNLSIIIPFKSDNGHRLAAIQYVIRYLLTKFTGVPIFVVEQDTTTAFPEGVTRIGFTTGTEMNRSKALNLGVAAATTERVLCLDADMLVDPAYVIGATLQAKEVLIPYFGRNHLTEGRTKALYEQNKPDTVTVAELVSQGRLLEPGTDGGCQLIHKAFYTELGGFNEKFVGHAPETGDFMNRVRKAGGRRIFPVRSASSIHLYHVPVV